MQFSKIFNPSRLKKEKFLQRSVFIFSLLAVVSSFFSISVFEAFLLLAIVFSSYFWIKNFKQTFKGLFTVPLLGHLSVITLSSILFLKVKEQWRRLLEQDFFSFSYFVSRTLEREYLEKLLKVAVVLSVLAGWVLSLKVLYTWHFHHFTKGFWGGNFIIGNLLAISFFSALGSFFYKDFPLWWKLFSLISAPLFVGVIFLPAERSVVLGLIVGLFIFFLALLKVFKSWKFRLSLVGVFIVSIPLSVFLIYQTPKGKRWFYLIKNHGINEQTLNSLSSGRVVIAKGALELIDKAIKEGDYLKLLIGWGYGPQKQYHNLPGYWGRVINEYESFLPLTAFINGGLLNVLFLLWFYVALGILTFRVLKEEINNLWWLKVAVISAVWVNMVYHLFTLFWVPINAIFYLLMGTVERLTEKGKDKNHSTSNIRGTTK